MQIIIDIIIFLFSILIMLLMILYIWRLWSAIANTDNPVTLWEIKIPKILSKSPKGIELALESLIQNGGVGTWYKRTIRGAGIATFSLEIASIEGSIHFYIRGQNKFKQAIESAFYAQYPGIEIVPVEDYVHNIFYDHRSNSVDIWGCEYSLSESFRLPIKNEKRVKANTAISSEPSIKADMLPIKTYIDYNMDQNPKEEYIIDPLSPILEWMNSMGPGENAYYQILLQSEDKFDGKIFPKTYTAETTGETFTSKELGQEIIESLRLKKGVPTKIYINDPIYDDYGNIRKTTEKVKETYKDADGKEQTREVIKEVNLKYGENFFTAEEKKQGFKIILEQENEINIKSETKDQIKLINNKLSKTRMRAFMRSMYIADKKYSKKGENIQTTLGLLRPFSGPGYNSFSPYPTSPFDNDWDDIDGKQGPWIAENFFFNYVERGGFYKHIEDRSKDTNILTRILSNIYCGLFSNYGLDTVWNIILFRKSFAYKYTFRYLYEIIFHPTHHPESKPFVLSLDEIATLWHFPNSGANISGINRINTTSSSFPNNLPL